MQTKCNRPIKRSVWANGNYGQTWTTSKSSNTPERHSLENVYKGTFSRLLAHTSQVWLARNSLRLDGKVSDDTQNSI